MKIKIPVKTRPASASPLTVDIVKENTIASLKASFAKEIDAAGLVQDKIAKIKAAKKKANAAYDAELKLLGETVDELTPLIESYQSLTNDNPDEPIEFYGTQYRLECGPKGKSRELTDLKGFADKIGMDAFWQIAKVNLGDVDKYLSQNEQAEFVKTERTSRGIKLIKL